MHECRLERALLGLSRDMKRLATLFIPLALFTLFGCSNDTADSVEPGSDSDLTKVPATAPHTFTCSLKYKEAESGPTTVTLTVRGAAKTISVDADGKSASGTYDPKYKPRVYTDYARFNGDSNDYPPFGDYSGDLGLLVQSTLFKGQPGMIRVISTGHDTTVTYIYDCASK
jgi:hypothetical protein